MLVLGLSAALLLGAAPVSASGLADSPWPMFRQNSLHSGRSLYTGPEMPQLKWSFTTGGVVRSSPAIGADGTIYAGSNDGRVYAMNPDGTEKWSFGTGGWVTSSPAIGSDGTIYVGSRDGRLYAVNPDGTEKWSFTTGGSVWSSPAIEGDGTICFGSDDGRLYAIDADGIEKWNLTTGGLVRSSPAIGSDGTIYLGSRATLYAVTLDGKQKWTAKTPNRNPNPSMPGGYVRSSPAIGAGGTIYAGCDAGYMTRSSMIFATDPDRTHIVYTKWWSSIGGLYTLSSPAIGARGTIYVGSVDGKVYALNPDGRQKWSFTIGGGVESSLAIGADGTIYVGSDDGKLYAIGETPPSGAPINYWGQVILEGSPALDGISVTGVIDGVQYAYTTTTDGQYRLGVRGDDPYTLEKEGYVVGDQIYFYIGDSLVEGGPYTVQPGDAGRYIRKDLAIPEAIAPTAAAGGVLALLVLRRHHGQ